MVEEIIGRLPYLTESQLGRLEDELRRERQRRDSGAALPLTEVLEYCPASPSAWDPRPYPFLTFLARAVTRRWTCFMA